MDRLIVARFDFIIIIIIIIRYFRKEKKIQEMYFVFDVFLRCLNNDFVVSDYLLG